MYCKDERLAATIVSKRNTPEASEGGQYCTKLENEANTEIRDQEIPGP